MGLSKPIDARRRKRCFAKGHRETAWDVREHPTKAYLIVVCAQSDLWAACVSVCQIVTELAADSSKEH